MLEVTVRRFSRFWWTKKVTLLCAMFYFLVCFWYKSTVMLFQPHHDFTEFGVNAFVSILLLSPVRFAKYFYLLCQSLFYMELHTSLENRLQFCLKKCIIKVPIMWVVSHSWLTCHRCVLYKWTVENNMLVC